MSAKQCWLIDVENCQQIYEASLKIDPKRPNPADVAYLQGIIEAVLGVYFTQNEPEKT